jgi:photosystem II stability/assembly factor-like uncharacterized protein
MAKLRLALGLLLLLGLLGSSFPALAEPDTLEWSEVKTPTDGKLEGWVLASGADIQHLTMSANGTIYAYGKGLSYTLYQSNNGGYSWSTIGKVKDTIVDIAIAPGNVVYYATSSQVYKSVEGASKFTALPIPGGVGVHNIEITSLDVTRLNDSIIAVSTRDKDNGQYGGVYILDEAQLFPDWVDMNIGNYDVYAVAFSPNFAADRRLAAVVSNETDTFVTTNSGGVEWGKTIGDARINGLVPVSASIAFPSDYGADTTSSYFVAIDSGSNQGDVYRLIEVEAPASSMATDLNIGAAYGLSNVDVTSLAVSGANLIAGAAASAEVYLSPDGGISWKRSTKPPTGESDTYVVLAPGKAYAATSGTESAFSISSDGGVSWNQTSLIDTKISAIIDLAPSPSYSQDETLFMLTNYTGGKDSLWRSLNGGKTWERVFSSALPDRLDRVALCPQL